MEFKAIFSISWYPELFMLKLLKTAGASFYYKQIYKTKQKKFFFFFFFAVCKTPVEGSLNKQQSKNWSGHVGQIKFLKEKKNNFYLLDCNRVPLHLWYKIGHP